MSVGRISIGVILITSVAAGLVFLQGAGQGAATVGTDAGSTPSADHANRRGPEPSPPAATMRAPIELGAYLAFAGLAPDSGGDHDPDLGLKGQLGRFLDASLPLPERLPDDLEQRLPSVEPGAEIAAVRRLAREVDAQEVVRHEAINLLRRSGDTALVEVLIRILADGRSSERMRGYAMQHLGVELEEGRVDDATGLRELVATAFVRDPHQEVRREAFLALVRTRHPEALRVLDDFDHPHVRDMPDLLLVAWQELDRRQYASSLPSLFDHEDEVVAIAAIALAGEWRVAEAELGLRSLTQHPSPRTRRAAEVALAKIDPAP